MRRGGMMKKLREDNDHEKQRKPERSVGKGGQRPAGGQDM